MPTEKPLRIAIARTGSFTDSRGRAQSFSESDLDAVIATYNPAKLEAPLVFGHPRDNDPAFGWVTALKREGHTLFADLAQVPDSVKKMVHDGRYRYVSMSLMPDKQRLRHVGLLGAAAPAIEGLGAVELTDGEDVICVEFTESDPKGASMNLEELQKQLEALKAENAALKQKLAEAEKGQSDTAAEFTAYKNGVTLKTRETRLDELVKAGKVTPAERAGCLSFAAALAEVEQPVEFAAADGKTESIPAEERYFRELAARPSSSLNVDFSAFAAPGHAVSAQIPAFTSADVTAKL